RSGRKRDRRPEARLTEEGDPMIHHDSRQKRFQQRTYAPRLIVCFSLLCGLAAALWTPSASADGNGKCNPTPDSHSAQAICFATLDLDPISCGIYYGCCYGDPSPPIGDPDCRNMPCAPGCPSDICIQSGGLTQSGNHGLDLEEYCQQTWGATAHAVLLSG